MTIAEFQKEIDALFPVKRMSDDFRTDLKNVLRDYKSYIRLLDDNIKTTIRSDWDAFDKRINRLIDGILKCVNVFYKSEHYKAYSLLYNQLNGLNTISPILTSIEFHNIQKGEFLWRGRVFNQNRGKNNKDMFHIPFEKRGVVRTQRYSASGYPCLYLGTSIHSCWEELGRPKFDNLMISGFRTTKNLKLLDIRRPQTEDFTEHKIADLLLRLPLILACSFITRDEDEDAHFKPEYIVPQILLETIINKNNKDREEENKTTEELVLGVIYTSTKTKDDFNRPIKYYENIAIPAVDVSKTNGHCPELANCFEITPPSCNEYEGLKEDVLTTWIYQPIEGEDPKDPVTQYEHSKMGVLEARIKNPLFFTPEKLKL